MTARAEAGGASEAAPTDCGPSAAGLKILTTLTAVVVEGLSD